MNFIEEYRKENKQTILVTPRHRKNIIRIVFKALITILLYIFILALFYAVFYLVLNDINTNYYLVPKDDVANWVTHYYAGIIK